MAKTGYVNTMIPIEQHKKLKELKDLLHAKTWGELVDKVYDIITSQTLEEACSKICEARKRPPLLEAMKA